jgi:hypothetical protein
MALSDLDFSPGVRIQDEVLAKFGTSISSLSSTLSPGFLLWHLSHSLLSGSMSQLR